MSKSTLCAGSLNPIIIVPIVLIGKLRLRKARDPPQVTQQAKGRPRIHFPLMGKPLPVFDPRKATYNLIAL